MTAMRSLPAPATFCCCGFLICLPRIWASAVPDRRCVVRSGRSRKLVPSNNWLCQELAVSESAARFAFSVRRTDWLPGRVVVWSTRPKWPCLPGQRAWSLHCGNGRRPLGWGVRCRYATSQHYNQPPPSLDRVGSALGWGFALHTRASRLPSPGAGED